MAIVSNNRKQSAFTVAASLGRGALCAVLTALPLCALLFFFETTRPARVSGEVYLATQTTSDADAQQSVWGRRGFVARFRDVSAQLGRGTISDQLPKMLVADASFIGLSVGFEAEFLTKERRRVWLRILSRDPIADQVVPDNARLMEISPASSAGMISFVWGRWIYRAQIEDRGFEPEVVVQKVL
jgi:hypothetical protein